MRVVRVGDSHDSMSGREEFPGAREVVRASEQEAKVTAR